VRLERIVAGRASPEHLVGGVLTADLVVAGARWAKGRRLTAADLRAFEDELASVAATVILLDPDELHEDEAAAMLAAAIAGPGLEARGPVQSRVDLRATQAGVLHVRVDALERINAFDPLEAFTAFDGSCVDAGDLVASAKIAPHVVGRAILDEAIASSGLGEAPVVRVAPYVPMRVSAIVKESLRASDRERFERSVRDKVESLGSTLLTIDYVADDDEPVRAALDAAIGNAGSDVVLTAGGRSTDPLDPFFTAIGLLGGQVVRRGVPAHPGSMLWLARIGAGAVLGLPTCGAYSKATAVDLVLPRLLTGEPPDAALVARLGHGGLLTRDQRFRFPAYARRLDAPDG
jgi:hypothetical protein